MNVFAWIQTVAPAPAAVQGAAQVAAQTPAAEPAVVEAVEELLPQASSFAASVDNSFVLILWFAVFLVILVAGSFALILLRRAATRSGSGEAPRSLYRWTAVGAFLLVSTFFVQGARVWADMQVVPRGALPIQVALEEKGWSFTYPNGFVSNELHLPLGRAVKFMLQGGLEPYTFAIPAFRLQAQVAVGEKREAWVQPTLPGEYTLRSTALSARKPDLLVAQTIVHKEGGYEKWYQDISGPPLDLPPIELGQRSYQMRGCTQCHTIDGSKLIGPSFKGFLAREHRMVGGVLVEATDEYIKESVIDPTAKVVEGFDPVMPSFKGRLHELEIAGLVAYIKSLQ